MPYLFLAAFAGGLILNALPCCLPVLSLKLMSLQKRSWSYAAGLVGTFAGLGLLASLASLTWGAHLQFTAWPLAVVCLVAGLCYLDILSMPSFGMREYESDFAKGIFVTLLASSCSGPLLGVVFAATLSEPPLVVVGLFTVMGFGFALPYLAFPRSWVPRPGAWMESFKHFAGWTLIATAGWLAYPPLAALVCLFALIKLVHGSSRLAIFTTSVAVCLLVVWSSVMSKPHVIEFNQGELDLFRSQGRVVLVEFTSKYCLTCQVNQATLRTRKVSSAIKHTGTVVMRASMPNGSVLLHSLGYASVPMMAIFPGDKEPIIILPDVVTSDQVVSGINRSVDIISDN